MKTQAQLANRRRFRNHQKGKKKGNGENHPPAPLPQSDSQAKSRLMELIREGGSGRFDGIKAVGRVRRLALGLQTG